MFCNSPPDVSIACVTYNHENFISETLAAFVKQKTTCKIEVVIGDDSSFDNTSKLINDFLKSHPELFNIVINDTNLGAHENFISVLKRCKGRYIALCDGDDWWTDEEKIQKQFDYLEKNKDVVLTYSSIVERENREISNDFVDQLKYSWTSQDLLHAMPVRTQTVMYRNVLTDYPFEFAIAPTQDLFIWSMLGHYGSAFYDSSIKPTIYNVHGGGTHSQLNDHLKTMNLIATHYMLYVYYTRIMLFELADYFLEQIKLRAQLCIKTSGKVFFESLQGFCQAFDEKLTKAGVVRNSMISELLFP